MNEKGNTGVQARSSILIGGRVRDYVVSRVKMAIGWFCKLHFILLGVPSVFLCAYNFKQVLLLLKIVLKCNEFQM